MQLAALILAKPSYDSKVLEREKQRLITALLEAQTKPETILQQNLRKAVYGKYPLAYFPTPKTVAAITVNDLRNFHSSLYRGDRISIKLFPQFLGAVVQHLGAVHLGMQAVITQENWQNLSIPHTPHVVNEAP